MVVVTCAHFSANVAVDVFRECVVFCFGSELSFIYIFEGQSKTTEPYLITLKSRKMDLYLDDILAQLYVIYSVT